MPILSVPGPSALAAALAASGFPAAPSTFLGFPPRKGRDVWVQAALARPETLVVYEAPGRVGDLVNRIAALLPERELCLCREVSKRFEEIIRAPAAQLATRLDSVRGECVLLVGPGEVYEQQASTVDAGASLKAIAAVLAERTGRTRREAYQMLLRWESGE